MPKKILFIIAQQNFRDEEYFHPKQVLENRGFKVVTASTRKEALSKFGQRVVADILLVDVKAENYDAVAFIGGSGAAQYFNDFHALNVAKSFLQSGKVTAAICIAPSILANAGLLAGKSATAFESELENLKSKGALPSGQPVTRDGLLITANGPAAAKAFGEQIAAALTG